MNSIVDRRTLPDHGMLISDTKADLLICFSHLRWDFVFQRPQHLMTRFARRAPVVVFEEPVWTDEGTPRLVRRLCARSAVVVATPHLSWHLPAEQRDAALRRMLDGLLAEAGARHPVLWFYTPMMFGFASHVAGAAVVYDCMDELSGFRFAPPELPRLEAALIARADTVFTGGHAIYEAKRHLHADIHAFPSSVDAAHFADTGSEGGEPADQRDIPHPRLGFYGVIDERMDLDLVAALADARPDRHVVMVGPVAKLDPATLPRRPNIHWLGPKGYDELPRYLGGWDVALMPFAINETTRFISPTKTLEYLAGGRVVVSTPVVDVVRHYAGLPAVLIAETPEGFVAACDDALALAAAPERFAAAVEAHLAAVSWQATFGAMARIVDAVVARRAAKRSLLAPLGGAPIAVGRAVPALGAGDGAAAGAGPVMAE